jgi:antitoxin (DNA-binding transcriptional repressor) of toxin-antitoxin stability system
MREIGAFDAKNKLGTLLDWVEAGETVAITGAARLWPISRPQAPLSISKQPKQPRSGFEPGVAA